jgi:hypothetical protein
MSSNDYLVYFTVGYNKIYINILKLAVKTLIHFNKNVDIVVICDESMESECKSILPETVKIITVPDSTQAAYASINKLRIFEVYPDILKYKSVLFVDSDILTHTDIEAYFKKINKPNTLYVYTEDTNPRSHLAQWFSFNNYTEQDISRFKKEKIYPFNAGCFGFCPTTQMKSHFNNITNFIAHYNGPLTIYEQSFMNVYFNNLNITDRDLLTRDTYIMFPYRDYPIMSHEGKLIHFTGLVGEGDIKYKEIKSYIDKFMPFLTV